MIELILAVTCYVLGLLTGVWIRGMKTWASIVLLLVALHGGGTASGQSQPNWIEVAPVQNFHNAQLGDLLSDIESHMPAGHVYRDSDLVTWGHETTHGINSRIRNELGRGTGHANGFYVLGNRGILFTEPNIRKASVGRYVEPEFQDDTFGLYVAGQSEWDAEPLYIIDEWTAYTNGTEVGLELAEKGLWNGGQRSETTENMLEFTAFAVAVLMAVHDGDPQYSQQNELTGFVRWNASRALNLSRRARSYPAFDSGRAQALTAEIESRWSFDADTEVAAQ